MESLCRLCMNFGSVGMEPIFRPVMASCHAAKIANVTQLTLIEGDGLPASVCQQCIFKLDVADTFIQKCTLSDKALRAMQTVQNECLTSPGSDENRYSWRQATSQSVDSMPSNSHRSASVLRFGLSKELKKDEISIPTITIVKIEDSDDADFSGADDTQPPRHMSPKSDERIARDDINSISEQTEHVSESDLVPNNKSEENDSVNSSLNIETGKEVPPQVSPEKHKCRVCHNEYTNKGNLARHVKNQHKAAKSRQRLRTVKRREARDVIRDNQTNSTALRPTKTNDASGSSNHHCSICGRSFISKLSLKKHTLRHSETCSKFSCNFCPKKFVRIDTLKRHKLNHSKEHLQCEICNKTFKLKKLLTNHVSLHFVERPYTCAVCDNSFARPSNLNSHMLVHSDVRPHECNKCGTKFKRKEHLRRHVDRYEKNGLCPQKNYSKKRSLKRTVKASDQGCVFPVPRQILSKSPHFENQVFANHEDDNENLYPCKDCGKTFSNHIDLGSHAQSHGVINEELFTCKDCGHTFSTHTDLESHKPIHQVNLENSFPCKDCGQTFRERTGLDIHTQSHDVINEKLFTCKLCKKTFDTRTDLEGHRPIHEGAREYLVPCTVCGRRFTSEASVAHHMSIHVRATRHKCPECTQCFKTSLGLKDHMKFHENNNKLMCSVCSETFSSQEGLQSHSFSHASELC